MRTVSGIGAHGPNSVRDGHSTLPLGAPIFDK
jgi:hypothetical protein